MLVKLFSLFCEEQDTAPSLALRGRQKKVAFLFFLSYLLYPWFLKELNYGVFLWL